MEEIGIAYKILVGKPQVKRPFYRPRRRRIVKWVLRRKGREFE